MKYQCGCPEFWHYWCCKHSRLGFGIHKNQTNDPEGFEIDIFAARGGGRHVIAEGGGVLTKKNKKRTRTILEGSFTLGLTMSGFRSRQR